MPAVEGPDPWGRRGPTDEFNTLACVNFAWNPWVGYAEGFRRAGQVLVDHLARHGNEQDFLVYPIVFTYRHALEIALKQVISYGRQLLDEQGDFPDTHNLRDLWNTCRSILERVFPGDSDLPDVSRAITYLVNELQSVDPEGDAFRYPVSSKRGGRRTPTLPGELRHIPLSRFAAEAERVLTWLDGADTAIDVYLDHKREMEAEYRR